MAKPVFLSYSTDDTAVATTIRDYLETQEVACWMAPGDIMPGLDYAEQIINAIESAVVLVLVLSESSNHSTYVRNEVERAVAKGKAIIPLRIHKVQPSRSLEFFISNHQWVEAWELPLAPKLDVLAEAIDRHIADDGRSHEEITPSRITGDIAEVRQAPAHNLPHQLTPFIGREHELAAIDELLAREDVRLVTILGPGGMGKTRLSLAVAERHLADARFAQGVYFVALAPLLETDHVVSTLADVLGLSLQSGEAGGPQQQVLEYLRTRSMLLVFDNFEHLLQGASLVAQILHVRANVRVLATSRERLRVPGEHLFQIHGLGYDDPAPHAAGRGAAEQLFVQSARQVLPDVDFGAEELIQISAICRLVGGMPLGIELAAAWIEVLTPEEIVAEIQRSLDFLEAHRRGGVEHHRSVRAVFDASWQRLTPAEQDVFAQLSIFRGGFTREAAEEVAGATLRLLSTLAGKSLIQHERARARYSLHELLCQFGEEHLRVTPETWEAARDRHSTHYTRFLRRQESNLKGENHSAAIAAIEIEIKNVRSAWRRVVHQRNVSEIDNSLESLYIFYMTKCWYREGEAAFREAAEALPDNGTVSKHDRVRARLLARQARMRQNVISELGAAASLQEIDSMYRQSLSILNGVGARGDMGFVLNLLAIMYIHSGRAKEGLHLVQEAYAIFREQDDQWGMGRALHDLGYGEFWIGNYYKAIAYFREGTASCEQRGDLRTLGDIANLLGESLSALGEYEEAVQAAQKALAARQKSGDMRGVAWSLQLLGDLAWRMGAYDVALERSQESLAIFQEIGLDRTADAAVNNLGNVACSLGDYDQARSHFEAVLKPHLQAGSLPLRWTVGVALLGMANVEIGEENPVLAAELLQLVLDHPVAFKTTKERATKQLADLSKRFPDQMPATIRPLEIVIAEVVNR